jgi:death-on-curing protein
MTRRWLLEDIVMAMHDEQIAEHGGQIGLRDAGLLASALARPQNQAANGKPSVFHLAAAYAFGIVRNHPFLDGNKRTGFLAAYTFLDVNGWELTAPEPEAVAAVTSLAAGALAEPEFADWLKRNAVRRSTKN